MKNKLLLVIILLLGLGLRLLFLSSRPFGFTWDEAALGYNAFSLLKTGRDEYGQIMPFVFKSFGDFKPGSYIYFTVLPVKLFGLSIFSTRLPSAIFGSLSILVIFCLVKRLLPNYHKLPLITSLILSSNPWAIHFSRGAWEANLALFLTLLAVTLFYYRKYALSILFFGLTFYTYQGAKLFTPLLVIGLLYFNKYSLKKSLQYLLFITIFTIPILLGFSSQSGRLKVYNVFSYTRNAQTISSLLHQDHLTTPNLKFNLFHAEVIDQGRGVIQRFLNHLSPRYLFVSGDWSNARHSIPYQGYFYYPQIIILLLGLIVAIKNYSPAVSFMLYWSLVAILPAAFSRDIVTGVRSLPLVIPLVIFCGVGLSQLVNYRKTIFVWSLFSIFFFIYFLDLYFIHLPRLASAAWLSAYPSTIKLISQHQDEYSDIYFSDKLGQPYIFVLFFNQVDPVLYQKSAHLAENAQGDVGQVTEFGKYHFGTFYWPAMRSSHSALFVGDIYELPEKDLDQSNLVNYGFIDPLRVVGLL